QSSFEMHWGSFGPSGSSPPGSSDPQALRPWSNKTPATTRPLATLDPITYIPEFFAFLVPTSQWAQLEVNTQFQHPPGLGPAMFQRPYSSFVASLGVRPVSNRDFVLVRTETLGGASASVCQKVRDMLRAPCLMPPERSEERRVG